MSATVFISYSHKDEALRDQLEVQLSMLKRQGLIGVWHDRRLTAGDILDAGISEHLERAHVALMLVSPDFLASDYCYEKEMARALERHREGSTRVIPVILRPCEWQHSPLGELLATPTDGKAITLWANPDEAFLDVVKSIRNAIKTIGVDKPFPQKEQIIDDVAAISTETKLPRSSNLRIQKEFTKADEDRFLLNCFEYIARFFRGSLEELQKRNDDIETRFRQIDGNSFTAVIYRKGKVCTNLAASCLAMIH